MREHYLKTLRGLILTTLLAVSITSAPVAPAADGCDAEFNAGVQAANARNAAKLAEMGFGPPGTNTDIPPQDSCKYLEYLRWRRPQLEAQIPLRNASEAACPTWNDNVGGTPLPQLLAFLDAGVAKYTQRCQQYVAQSQQPTPYAAPGTYVPSNQSASCSTITGPGMPAGPANCPPNQQRLPTAVPPPHQASVAPAPARAPAPVQAAPVIPDPTQILQSILEPAGTDPNDHAADELYGRAQVALCQNATSACTPDCGTAADLFAQAAAEATDPARKSSFAQWRAQAADGTLAHCPPARTASAPMPAPAPAPAPVLRTDLTDANNWWQKAKAIDDGKHAACTDLSLAVTYYQNADTAFQKAGDPASARQVEARVAALQQYLKQNYPGGFMDQWSCNQRGTPVVPTATPGSTPPPDMAERCAQFHTVIFNAGESVASSGGDITNIKNTVRGAGCTWTPPIRACVSINMNDSLSAAEKAARRNMLECK